MMIDWSWVELPFLLPLVLILPVAFALLLRRARASREHRLLRFGALDVVRRLIPDSALVGSLWRAIRLGLAAALAGLAIAGPRWGHEKTTVRSSGVDMVLAVDASLSMMATDEKPNRLERVKQEIRRLRAISPGDRVGLLAFAGRSYVLTPITVDGGALDLFLDNLDPSVVGQAGTSLASTITQGTSLLDGRWPVEGLSAFLTINFGAVSHKFPASLGFGPRLEDAVIDHGRCRVGFLSRIVPLGRRFLTS